MDPSIVRVSPIVATAERPPLHATFAQLGVVVAEVDRELRYVRVESPHPDFSSTQIIGKRDDELIPPAEAAVFMAFKRSIFERAQPVSAMFRFPLTNGDRYYSVTGYPIPNESGTVESVMTVGFECPSPKNPR